jgi:CheY-like chemotaxis protein
MSDGRQPEARARVLVIDDNALIGMAIQRTLRAHDVRCETDPTSALEGILDGQRYDLILCDFYMPKLRGDSIFRAISMFAPELLPAFVFLTGGGLSLSPAEQAVVETAPGGFLVKPFEADELRALAAAAVARRGSGGCPRVRRDTGGPPVCDVTKLGAT